MSDPIFRLMERHQQLDARLQSARTRRWTDPFEIARLKKLKLALKDRLAACFAEEAAQLAAAQAAEEARAAEEAERLAAEAARGAAAAGRARVRAITGQHQDDHRGEHRPRGVVLADEAAETGPQMTIQGQFQAFRAGEDAKAYSFAAPSIARAFSSST